MRDGWKFAVVSMGFKLLAGADGAGEGAGAGLECVLPAAGGCELLDLLLADFELLELALADFDARLTGLVADVEECGPAFTEAGCTLGGLADAALFAEAVPDFAGAAAGPRVGGSVAVVRTMSTGALAAAGGAAGAETLAAFTLASGAGCTVTAGGTATAA